MSKKSKDESVDMQLHTVTGRFNDLLFKKMQEWLSKNGISANQLLAKAVERYISEPQVLEPVEMKIAADEEVDRAVGKLMKEHKRALKELK